MACLCRQLPDTHITAQSLWVVLRFYFTTIFKPDIQGLICMGRLFPLKTPRWWKERKVPYLERKKQIYVNCSFVFKASSFILFKKMRPESTCFVICNFTWYHLRSLHHGLPSGYVIIYESNIRSFLIFSTIRSNAVLYTRISVIWRKFRNDMKITAQQSQGIV